YLTNLVTGIYHRYLGRDPDPTGLAAWVALLQHGLTDEQLEAGFIGSPEYIHNHGGTSQAWVVGMYHDLLGRTPADFEVNYWLNQLASGVQPSAVAYGFAASKERESQRVVADYQRYLGRTPQQFEIDYWVDQFTNHHLDNEAVVAGFVGSIEYFQ